MEEYKITEAQVNEIKKLIRDSFELLRYHRNLEAKHNLIKIDTVLMNIKRL
jgi:hypothetical protein